MARASALFCVVLAVLAPAVLLGTRMGVERGRALQVMGSAEREGGLEQVRTLSFDFIVRDAGKPDLVFRHAYDEGKALYRYACLCADFARVPVADETAGGRWQVAPDPPSGKGLVALYHFPRVDGTVYIDGKPLAEPENTRILRRVHSRVMNERAWMFLPLLLGSTHPHLSPAPVAMDAEHGRLEGFEARWGAKRGDSDEWTVYTIYRGLRREIVRTDHRLKHNLKVSTTAYWSDWQWHGPVRIAHKRFLPANGRTLLFTDVRVNQPVDVSAPGQGL